MIHGCLHDDCLVNICAMESKEQTNEIKLRLNLQIAKEHQQYNQLQKQQFKMQKKDLMPHEVVAVIDFKENLHLNMATEETSCNYYDKLQ